LCWGNKNKYHMCVIPALLGGGNYLSLVPLFVEKVKYKHHAVFRTKAAREMRGAGIVIKRVALLKNISLIVHRILYFPL